MTQVFRVFSKPKKKKSNTAASRALDASWEELKKKWEPKKPLVAPKKVVNFEPKPFVRETPNIPSRGTGFGNATKADAPVYTGTKMIGIGQLHKSNGIPVFQEEDAKDLAKMRR